MKLARITFLGLVAFIVVLGAATARSGTARSSPGAVRRQWLRLLQDGAGGRRRGALR